jgi:hypothetical protein
MDSTFHALNVILCVLAILIIFFLEAVYPISSAIDSSVLPFANHHSSILPLVKPAHRIYRLDRNFRVVWFFCFWTLLIARTYQKRIVLVTANYLGLTLQILFYKINSLKMVFISP